MAKHSLKLNDTQLLIVQEALKEFKPTFANDVDVILVQIKALWDAQDVREKTARIPRSKEDLAREALIVHIEDVLFNENCRTETAKDFRERFLGGRENEIPRIKKAMLSDAKKFPKPTDEEWEWNGEKPDYWGGKDWRPWYSGRVNGLHCEISLNKKLTKVVGVYIEVD